MSVIIPTLNEEKSLFKLLPYLLEIKDKKEIEFIIVDGGSDDKTVEVANLFSVRIIQSPQKSRAIQMNLGAQNANGEILYFLHADAIPPKTVFHDILKEIENGFKLGGFRFKFDSNKILLKLNAWFTRFPFLICRGGDQSMFVEKDFFIEMNGFDESYLIMEEYDFMLRGKSKTKFKLIHKDVFVSARKYEKNSWLKVQRANFIAFRSFKKGKTSQEIFENYKKSLN